MRKRSLGKTGLSVSVLGWGTVKIGRNEQVKYPGARYELPSDEHVSMLLDRALSLGINLIDTAPAYGSSEERLGRLLGARREQFVMVTKVGEIFVGGHSRYDFSAEHVERSVLESLRRLRTDRVECVLLHCPREDVEVLTNSPALGALEKLKQRGHIRSYGASTHTVAGGELAVRKTDVVMVTYHEGYDGERPVIDLAHALGKGVLIKKGLKSGHLAVASEESQLRANFAHILGTPGVTSLIAGTLSPEHLAMNARLVDEAVTS